MPFVETRVVASIGSREKPWIAARADMDAHIFNIFLLSEPWIALRERERECGGDASSVPLNVFFAPLLSKSSNPVS